ncbi:hypothetical protein VY88_33105 [Azospirillum thiophilum]|uniref:Uncharacterized protein n=1 Tax=Azospirillum thiophilum TaxID=528244 RepID=A0AAC9EYW1_9PROT|nr:hypothetical protein [Azospirillum thiophilum]ALG75761.1 hypothetical protein AL072_33060 [Azospirillum thiophilum]KJR61232.1 hypothetical protein VY88_33105 [Azospirillum thiophilum]
MPISAAAVISFVLATINAPRPQRMTPADLLACLHADQPDRSWSPHIEALFDECSHESLQDLVLAGATDFFVLERALVVWSQGEAHTAS